MLKFTRNEMIDVIIAFIVLSIAFAIANTRLDVHGFISILPIVMVSVALSSIVHEIGHKYVAMKHGYQAEFKAWPLGLVITFISSFIGFVVSLPGSVQTYADDISDEINGKISIAGPMANIALALIFIVVAALIFPLKANSNLITLIYLICTVGFSVNSFLATFNLFPLYSLDGTKIFKWNIGIWCIVFAISVVMLIASITIGAENMVKFIINSAII